MEIRQLNISAGPRMLIRELSMTVQAGECWTIIGRNGAGKTTLLRTLAGLRAIESGQILLQQKAIQRWSLSDLARQRAYLPQGRADAFAYSALEMVLSARHPYQDARYWETGDDVELALAALASLDVADLAGRDVRSLSGGERQRVAIAALLAQDAQLMLLDEPANALDLSHQVSIMQLLHRLCAQQQKAAVMVSHDLNLAQRSATHALLLMGDGRWLAGPAAQMMDAALLGECLGHPVECHQIDGQRIFLPTMATS